MKTLGRIKLNQFSKEELDQRKLNALKGGCGCEYSCSNSVICVYPPDNQSNAENEVFSYVSTY